MTRSVRFWSLMVGWGYRYPENQSTEFLGTWEFDGNVWTEIITPNVPRSNGGKWPTIQRGIGWSCSEVQRISGREIAPIFMTAPIGRRLPLDSISRCDQYGFSMAYNSRYKHKNLLCADESGETWEWDGINWSRLYPIGVTPSTRYAGMAYDSHRKNFILFGGDI